MNNIDEIINQIILPNNGLLYASSSTIKYIEIVLSSIITNERVINFILSIRQQNLRDSLFINFFSKIKDSVEINKNTYLRIMAILLASPDAYALYNDIFNEIDQIFDNSNDPDTKAEATDIMLTFYPKRGEKLLNKLRNTEGPDIRAPDLGRRTMLHYDTDIFDEEQGETLLNEIRNNVHDFKPSEILIYNDRENVHNATINKSIISTCRSLMNLMVSSVIFDDKYKIIVFEEDTLETIKDKLAITLNSVIEDQHINSNQLKIYGDNDKEQLQSRMTFKISTPVAQEGHCVERNESAAVLSEKLKIKSRFKLEDRNLYKNIMYCNDFEFPIHLRCSSNTYSFADSHMVNDSDSQLNTSRLLEEIFIATNTWLDHINENKPHEMALYLSLTGVEDADLIWLNRDKIKKELQLVVECSDIENFINKVRNKLFPYDVYGNRHDFVFEKIKTGTLLDMDLYEILNATWKFIQRSEYKIEMLKRLHEELDDSSGICCSGIAARLVNSIQGFFDETKYSSLKIKININDEMKAKINKIISDYAQKQDIDPLYDKDKFKQLIDDVIKARSREIMDEFSSEDILKNGINEENILRLAYELYQIKS